MDFISQWWNDIFFWNSVTSDNYKRKYVNIFVKENLSRFIRNSRSEPHCLSITNSRYTNLILIIFNFKRRTIRWVIVTSIYNDWVKYCCERLYINLPWSLEVELKYVVQSRTTERMRGRSVRSCRIRPNIVTGVQCTPVDWPPGG